jgi:hypothetical protein
VRWLLIKRPEGEDMLSVPTMNGHFKVFVRHFISAMVTGGILVLSFIDGAGFQTDRDSHPPPSEGPYEYSPPGTFLPGSERFPQAGQSYADPVFGQTVKRVTSTYPKSDRHVSYSAKLVMNATNTMTFLQSGSGEYYLYDTKGSVLRTNPNGLGPKNENWQWHPTDADKILFMTESELKEYSFLSDSAKPIKVFGLSLNNGGTGEFTDQNGRYYAGLVGDRLRFFDRAEDVFYEKEPVGIKGNDYILIAPDGSGVLVVGGGTKAVTTWYPVDHGARSFKTEADVKPICDATPHGDLITDSDGRTWFFCAGGSIQAIGGTRVENVATLYKIPVEKPSDWAYVLRHDNWSLFYDFSANIRGKNRDWACWCVNWAGNDLKERAPWRDWSAFKDEILLINIKTGDLRRLCHHRSRNTKANYWWEPKASLSSDGRYVIFSSNMGRASGNYVDAYIVTTGLQ